MGFHFITIIIITEKNKTINANLSFGAANYEDFRATDIGTDCFSSFFSLQIGSRYLDFSVIHCQY